MNGNTEQISAPPSLHFDQRKSEDLRLPELPERRKDDSAIGIPECSSVLLFRNIWWGRLARCLLLLVEVSDLR